MDYQTLISAARASGTWNRDAINALLITNDRAVERALVVLHDRQTESEKDSRQTTQNNGVGFSGLDAEFFSSLAERVKKGWALTPKQLACCRKLNKNGWCRLAKYHGQLRDVIANKQASKIAA